MKTRPHPQADPSRAPEETVCPRIPLFRSDDPDLCEKIDEALAGFGDC